MSDLLEAQNAVQRLAFVSNVINDLVPWKLQMSWLTEKLLIEEKILFVDAS